MDGSEVESVKPLSHRGLSLFSDKTPRLPVRFPCSAATRGCGETSQPLRSISFPDLPGARRPGSAARAAPSAARIVRPRCRARAA
ncbi:hypothetical protein Y026_5663 [Burkholderia pseudomallei TSV28]|nr:hypothetical protein Y026_5663 [Burkholderia pseudomallei TSV28]